MFDTGTLAVETFACKKCKALRLATEFPVEKRNKSGLSGTCRECTNTQALPQREKRKAIVKERRGATWGPKETPEGRRCSMCHERKPIEAFSRDKGHYDGIAATCKICSAKGVRDWMKSLPPEVAAKKRHKRRIKHTYGLTLDVYDALIEAQANACKICRDPFGDGRERPQIDHDHMTGAVRGLLCIKCNAGLGQFRDNVAFLAEAIGYLERARGQVTCSVLAEDDV